MHQNMVAMAFTFVKVLRSHENQEKKSKFRMKGEYGM